MKKIGLEVTTSIVEGNYRHLKYDIGIDSTNKDMAISNKVYRLFEQGMECLCDEIPEGSEDLKFVVTYKRPKSP